MKINSDFNLFAGSNFDPAQYVASPAYGVNRFMLDRLGDEKARATTIVEYQPNSKFPQHQHIGGEEFVVLKGTFKDQFGKFPAGTYVRNPVDSVHAPWVDGDGCTIFVKLLQMTDEGDTTPLHVNYDERDERRATDYGTQLPMYRSVKTGEFVQMCWLDAGKELPVHAEGLNGGEELFVVAGRVEHDGVTYSEWGWLRFPPSQQRTSVKAGDNGAQLYRKIGHLAPQTIAMEKIQIDPETEEIRAL